MPGKFYVLKVGTKAKALMSTGTELHTAGTAALNLRVASFMEFENMNEYERI